MTDPYAPGLHLLADFWGARQPNDPVALEALLRRAADACGATVLGVHLHGFGEAGGLTGVAILAESHISLHSWPERDYIAFDIFLCGARDPMPALAVLEQDLTPKRVELLRHPRGAA